MNFFADRVPDLTYDRSDTIRPRLDSGTGAICDDCASQNDIIELDSIVIADEVSGHYYWDYCRMHVMLRMEARVHRALQAVHERGKPDLMALTPWESDALLATIPTTISSVLPPTPTFLSTAYHGTIGFFSQELPFSLLIATLLTGFGLWIASLVYVSSSEKIAQDSSPPVQSSFDPTLKVVGKITGMVDCRWADPQTETFNGANVLLGRKYAMASGLMEITYYTGAKVILQGPVTYEVESKNGGFMPVGKLTGKVEIEAAKGFSVRTPTATVTDLGTEFGVEVNKDGHTFSRVFRGSVRVQRFSDKRKPEGAGQVLRENESVVVNNRNHDRDMVVITDATSTNFIRQISSRSIKILDLVDVVAGGDGYSGRRNAGINMTNGRTAGAFNLFTIAGDGKYHRVEGLPFVDGVFIPKGGNTRVQLDSAGHTFAAFDNSNDHTCGPLWAGGTLEHIPRPTPPFDALREIPAVLDGVDYSAPPHGLLFLQSNKGIAFDLEAIRRANPGCNSLRFRAMVANTEIHSHLVCSAKCADAWVFVDGRERFTRRRFNSYGGASSVAVDIDEQDRFLTLVATDGGDDVYTDWIMFGDPRLEMWIARGADVK